MAIFDLFKSESEREREEKFAKKRKEREANRAVKKNEVLIQKLMQECENLEAEAKQLIRSGNKANQARINFCSKLYTAKMNSINQLQKSQLSNEHAISTIGVANAITETTNAIAGYSTVAAPDLVKLDQNQQQIASVTDSLSEINDIISEGYETTIESIDESSLEAGNGVDLQVNAWTEQVAKEVGGTSSAISDSTEKSSDVVDNSLEARIARLSANKE